MNQFPDELAGRRASKSATGPVDEEPSADSTDQVAADASAPDVLDLAAAERDVAAAARDQSAEDRDADAADVGQGQQAALDRIFAARDRLAAALDREEAALDRHRAAQYLEHAYRDELTGVLQREAGRDLLGQAVDRTRRNAGQLVIAFLDVDHLKHVNDKQGHPAGDRLLREVGTRLRRGLRSYDLIIRYGGDEFVCALPDANLDEAERRLLDIKESLSDKLDGGSFSFGLVTLTKDEGLEDVIARADRAMYAARDAARRPSSNPAATAIRTAENSEFHY